MLRESILIPGRARFSKPSDLFFLALLLSVLCAGQSVATLNFSETWTETNYSINGWSKCDWAGVSSSTPWVTDGFFQTIMSAGTEGSILSRNISNSIFDDDFTFTNIVRQNTTHVLNYGAAAFNNNCSVIETYIILLYLENKYNDGNKYDEIYVGGDCSATAQVVHNSGFQLDVDYNYTTSWNAATHNMTTYRNGTYIMSTIITCTDFSKFNLYLVMPRDNGYTRFNYSDMDISEPVAVNNLTIYSPADYAHDNRLLNVSFNVSGTAPTYSCELSVDGALNTTMTASNGAIEHIIASGMSEGNHTWSLNCTNTTASKSTGLYHFIYDLTSPYIQLSLPSQANDTIFTGGSMSITGNVSDENLWRVNLTITNSTDSVMYNNYSGDMANRSFYPLDAIISTGAWAEGMYSMLIDSADSHTDKIFEKVQHIDEIESESRYVMSLSSDRPEIVVGRGLAMDFYQENDRVSFLIKADRPERKSFILKTHNPLIKVSPSAYACHHVFGKYWFDCEGLDNAVATQLSENELLIEFDVLAGQENDRADGELIMKNRVDGAIPEKEQDITILMRSLGGLNENNLSITFQVDNCMPAWTCSEFALCNMTNGLSCLNVTDTNMCGDAFGGILSDYDTACTFMNLSVTMLSPANNTLSSTQLTAAYNANKQANCTLYVNGAAKGSEYDIIGNSSISEALLFEGLYTFRISCVDIFQTASTGLYNYLYVPSSGGANVVINEADNTSELMLAILSAVFLTLFIIGVTLRLNIFVFISGLGFLFIGFNYLDIFAFKLLFAVIGVVFILVWAMFGLRPRDDSR